MRHSHRLVDILLFYTVTLLICSNSFGFFCCNVVPCDDYGMSVCAYVALLFCHHHSVFCLHDDLYYVTLCILYTGAGYFRCAILVVLQEQVQGLDPSRSTDARWIKWLDPTVNVLYTFSSVLGSGFSLVCLRTCTYLRSALLYFCSSYSPPQASYLPGLASCFQCVSFITSCGPL